MSPERPKRLPSWTVALAVVLLIAACVAPGPGSGAVHRWWQGLGPVLPHESFPGDCKLCHVGDKWHSISADFQFDHEKRTGVKLEGAHTKARCLLCHNDRGPVAAFRAKGCVGCHEDRHAGRLGTRCETCHTQRTWQAVGMIEMHNRTRFPLTGAHAAVACNRCHPGAFVGNFVPSDSDCTTCHAQDAANTTNPPHLNLGWVDRCERCHTATRWENAFIK